MTRRRTEEATKKGEEGETKKQYKVTRTGRVDRNKHKTKTSQKLAYNTVKSRCTYPKVYKEIIRYFKIILMPYLMHPRHSIRNTIN